MFPLSLAVDQILSSFCAKMRLQNAGAIIRGRGTCSTCQSFNLTYRERTTFIDIYGLNGTCTYPGLFRGLFCYVHVPRYIYTKFEQSSRLLPKRGVFLHQLGLITEICLDNLDSLDSLLLHDLDLSNCFGERSQADPPST